MLSLPKIKGHNDSPLKGFIDMSITKQRVNKAVNRMNAADES